jgi:glycosyltransferase involved in cell wall biosynthesis
LGNYQTDTNRYHRQVLDAASDEVIFPGAIYDSHKLNALRFFARYYIHGHQVGGTNPSLVEALGAGNAVIAHDNPFNRWVAGDAGMYFFGTSELASIFDNEYTNNALAKTKQSLAIKVYSDRFQWKDILSQYEALLLQWHD